MKIRELKKVLAKNSSISIYRDDAFLLDCPIYSGRVQLIPEAILNKKIVMAYPGWDLMVVIVKAKWEL